MPQLDFSTYFIQLFWLALFFFLLYGIVRYLFIPSIESRIERRSATIEKNLSEANSMIAQSKKAKERSELILQNVREEAKAILAHSEKEIKKIIDDKNKEAELSSAKHHEKTREEIELMKAEISSQIPSIVEDLEGVIVKRLINHISQEEENVEERG